VVDDNYLYPEGRIITKIKIKIKIAVNLAYRNQGAHKLVT
jgi:hypothetical protein